MCVLYYIVKGILAETLVFGARGEQECWAVYFRWRIHLQTLDYFLSTPVYRKTKLRPQSRVLTKSTKKGTEFSEGWGRGDIFLFKNTEAWDVCSSVHVLLSTVCLQCTTCPPSRFPLSPPSVPWLRVFPSCDPAGGPLLSPLFFPLAAAIPRLSGVLPEASPLPRMPSGLLSLPALPALVYSSLPALFLVLLFLGIPK